MKQLFSAALFFLFFQGTPPPKAPAWEGTYQCLQAFYQNPRTQYKQNCAFEIKLIGVDKDTLVTIRNMVNRKMRVLRIIECLGQKQGDGVVSTGYRVMETGTDQVGILALNFRGDQLNSIALIGSEFSVLLTVFYPIYLKT